MRHPSFVGVAPANYLAAGAFNVTAAITAASIRIAAISICAPVEAGYQLA